jgi:signal transduction histidine kinase/DNA-binding response OmpR family regulator/CHASE3 domain sensor protein
MRKPPRETVKTKILLGYLFLTGIAAFTVWLIYSEILLYSENKTRISKLNNKILYFNSVLTNLYQAESLERTYSQTGNTVHYENYEKLMDAIHLQFDSLSALADNPAEKFHTDSIMRLLEMKRRNFRELILIKRNSSADIYEKALNRFNYNRDSISSMLSKRGAVFTNKKESTLKKMKFLERLLNAFNQPDTTDSSVTFSKSPPIIQIDTVTNEFNAADSVIQFLTSILSDLRNESRNSEELLNRKESAVLANDRTIMLQLREMLTIFEKDIFVNSLTELQSLQDRIRLTTWYLIALGALALVVIIFFITLILKDITKSQHYRFELEQAKAFSDSLLKTKEQFMLSITHDLKSPVASVTGYARLLHESEDTDKKKHYLESINKAADHILTMISDLADFTRLETGQMKIEPVPFSIHSLTNEIYDTFYPLAVTKNLEFSVHNQIDGPAIYRSDPLRIRQVLGNLISNAIKYTAKGSVQVNVLIEKRGNSSDTIRFEITDTGVGISENDSKIIFNEFTRLESKGGLKNEGVGLGLSIAQRIVNLLNGTIFLESTPGSGSCFTVILALDRSEMPVEQMKKYESVPLQSQVSTGKIMVIDDDEVFLEMTAETIEKAGMQVIRCNSALQAIRIMEHSVPELIITDIQMPNMNGLDLLAYLQRKNGKKIPVIAVTGQDSPDFSNVDLSACLKKPFPASALLKAIEKALGKNKLKKEIIEKSSEKSGSNDVSTPYNLDQIKQFALNDEESVHKILVSFVETSFEHLTLFNHLVQQHDRKYLGELAHKMLAMFRQLEAWDIVNNLLVIERSEDYNLSDNQWTDLAKETAVRIESFIDLFCEEQGILIR